MAEVSTAIWMALKERIELIQGWAIAWPAMSPPYAPDGKTHFLAVSITTAPPSRLFINRRNISARTGTLSISVMQPIQEPAVQIYNERAAKVAAHFDIPDNAPLVYDGVKVSAPEQPHVADGYRDNGYWRIPVNVGFRAFA